MTTNAGENMLEIQHCFLMDIQIQHGGFTQMLHFLLFESVNLQNHF